MIVSTLARLLCGTGRLLFNLSVSVGWVGWVLSEERGGKCCQNERHRLHLLLAPDEQDVEVDGGEDEEGDGYEEEKDVPGIEYKGDDDALLHHAPDDDEVKFEKV